MQGFGRRTGVVWTIVLGLATSACVPPVRGQTTAPAPGDSSAHVGAGASGLIFLVQQDLTLGAFDGAVISYRRGGWRYGLNMNASYQRVAYHDQGPLSSNDRATYDQGGRLGVTAQRIGERAGPHGASVFWAAGPQMEISRSRSWQSATRDERRVDGWSVGLLACAGAEYLIADRVSLLGEYGVSAAFAWNRQDDLGPEPFRTTSRTRSFTIAARAVRLGLTAWFR